MPENQPPKPKCAECGREIFGESIVISADEQLCPDCWPFLLKPLVQDAHGGARGAPARGQ